LTAAVRDVQQLMERFALLVVIGSEGVMLAKAVPRMRCCLIGMIERIMQLARRRQDRLQRHAKRKQPQQGCTLPSHLTAWLQHACRISTKGEVT
jgi:hypothetical protein